jgi:hypothetical protein
MKKSALPTNPTLIKNSPPHSTTLTLPDLTPGQRPGRMGHYHSTHPVTRLQYNLINQSTSLQLPSQHLFCELCSISTVQLVTMALNAKKPILLKHISFVGLSLCTGKILLLLTGNLLGSLTLDPSSTFFTA